MSLKEIQDKLKNTLLQPEYKLSNTEDSFEALFESNHISIRERLKVYHSNVVGSLVDAIQENFPLLENLVGDVFLREMARHFVFNNPPKSASLFAYGEDFPSFINTYEQAKTLPYLSDIAALEWALHGAYYAKDDHTLKPDTLAQLTHEELPLVQINLRASAALVTSRYPLIELRKFCLNDGKGTAPNLEEEQTCKLLITRPHLEVQITPLQEDEYHALTLLSQNKLLGEVVEDTIEHFTTFDFASFLQKHIALETFSSLGPNGIAAR